MISTTPTTPTTIEIESPTEGSMDALEPVTFAGKPSIIRSAIQLNVFPTIDSMQAAGTLRTAVYVSTKLCHVIVAGEPWDLPDMIHVRFREDGRGAAPAPAVRLTVNRFERMVAAFDGSDAARDPVMRERMERILDAYGQCARVESIGDERPAAAS